jgi:Fic family protein
MIPGKTGIGVTGIGTDESSQIQRINALKLELDALRPIKPEYEQSIRQKFRLDWTYHSNSIEGNSLTYGETAKLILFDEYASNKPGRDNREIEEHNKLLKELETTPDLKGVFTEHNIRAFHKKILGNDPYTSPALTPENQATSRVITPGRYKQEPNNVKTVTGEVFEFTSPADTPSAMKELLDWANTELNSPTLHPLVFAAALHYRFIRIHPFDDGNGRMARILMNVVLQYYGYPPIIVRKNDKEKYLSALRDADTGNVLSFTFYLSDLLIDSLKINIRGAKGENISEEDDIDKEIELTQQTLLTEREREKKALLSQIDQRRIILEKAFIPLIENLDKKLSKIRPNFPGGRTVCALKVEGINRPLSWEKNVKEVNFSSHFTEIKTYIPKLSNIPISINYFCTFSGQSKLLRAPKELNAEVFLTFYANDYQIRSTINGSEVGTVIKKNYDEYFESEELTEYTAEIIRSFLLLLKK